MHIEEIYQLEKNDRLDLEAHNISPEADDFIFSINEFEFFKSLYDTKEKSDHSLFPSFTTKDLKEVKSILSNCDFTKKGRESLISLFNNLQLGEDQKSFLEVLSKKLDEVETDWEYEDENRWELLESLKNISVLFMMNEIEREFGDSELTSATMLNDDEFEFLSIVHEDETKNKKEVTIGNLTFNLEQLDYVREIITTLEYPEDTPLHLDQEQFILNILEKCSHLNDEEPDEYHTFSIQELYEIESSSISNNDETSIFADNNFSKVELKLLEAVFNEKDFVKIGDSRYNRKQLRSLKNVFEEEHEWEDVKKYFSETQQELISHILLVYENQFLIDDDEIYEEGKIDIEVFYLMDQIERNEMENIGSSIGELIFNDPQYELLDAVYKNKKGYTNQLHKITLKRAELDKISTIFEQLPQYQSGKLVVSLPKNAKKFVDQLIDTAIKNDPKI